MLSTVIISELYEESELQRAIYTANMSVRAKELNVESEFKSIISVFDKKDKELENEYKRDRALSHQHIPLMLDGKGIPMQTIDNFLMIMRNDTHYENIQYNLLIDAPEVRESKSTRRYSDADESASRHYIEKMYHLHHKDKHTDALTMLMREREYHPIRGIVDTVKWDGVERIGGLLTKWLKCDDTEYTKEVSRLIFAGGINRLYNPGCKFEDTPVLIGTAQGEGKSTFVKWLAVHDKYYREVSEIEGQKGMESIEGAWICEFGELLAVTKTKEKDAIKAYLSRTVDTYRKPWGRHVAENPRQCIFIGTTNRSEFLTDNRNRRFYPVVCHSVGYDIFDHEAEIREDVLQCWAEAKHKMLNGNMPAFANRTLLTVIREQQEIAKEDDWRVGALDKYLKPLPIGSYVCIRQLKREALCENAEFPKDPLPKESQEISIMMAEFLEWEKVGRYSHPVYGQQRCWRRTSNHDLLKSGADFVDCDELPDFK